MMAHRIYLIALAFLSAAARADAQSIQFDRNAWEKQKRLETIRFQAEDCTFHATKVSVMTGAKQLGEIDSFILYACGIIFQVMDNDGVPKDLEVRKAWFLVWIQRPRRLAFRDLGIESQLGPDD